MGGGDNAGVGELRGRGDQPPDQPDKPAEADPSWNTTKDGSKLWRVIRASDDMFAPPGESRPDRSRLEYEKPSPDDRPAERPPSGEELREMESPDASRMDKARNKVMDADFLGDAFDAAEHWGRDGLDLLPSDRPTGKAEVCVPMPDKAHWVQGHDPGMDGGELATGMLVVGFMIGHGTMWAHRKWSERKSQA